VIHVANQTLLRRNSQSREGSFDGLSRERERTRKGGREREREQDREKERERERKGEHWRVLTPICAIEQQRLP